jgi:hypothetical protein
MGELEVRQLEAMLIALRPRFVFEWGSGGSTTYFPRLFPSLQWAAVEHDAAWFELVGTEAARLGLCSRSTTYGHPQVRASFSGRVVIDHVPPDLPFDLKNGIDYGLSEGLVPGAFRSYVDAIDGFSGIDLVLVDGRARNACIRKAAQTRGRTIIVHDAQRHEYKHVLTLLGARRLDGWSQGQFAVVHT